MLDAGWLIAAVVLAVLLTSWVTFTLTRLDRLHARVDATQAALDAQLVRRAAAVLHVAESSAGVLGDGERRRLEQLSEAALNATLDDRELAENAIGRAVVELAASPVELVPTTVEELHEAGTRVLIARRFYNDAVRDTRALRGRRMPRLLHLAGHRDMPQFFDIDDTLPVYDPPDVGSGRTDDGSTSQEEITR
ncbi:MAG TPA: NUDIX hydrolase [Jatrophihabitantaceae bacterium]|jgi:hypothetical protein